MAGSRDGIDDGVVVVVVIIGIPEIWRRE